MCQLSNNFNLHEFTLSQTASRLEIAVNVPPESAIFQALQKLCTQVLQPLRDSLGRVIHITSGYRPPALNRHIGGSKRSQHMRGEAADIVVGGMNPLEVCQAIVRLNLPFDQLIHEFGRWTHVSVAPEHRSERGQTLTAWKNPSLKKTEYLQGLSSISEIENAHIAGRAS